MTQIEKYCDNLIKSVVASIEAKGGANYLSSIILTGSFGRNEPTFSLDEDGFKLKSDVEIALVVRRSPKQVEKIMAQVSQEFEEDLNLMIIEENRVKRANNFNYTLIPSGYKTIFTYDLFNGSKTIWGRDYIGERDIRLSDVDLYEAKRIIANRIGELIYLQETAAQGDREQLRKQWKGKLVLAIVSAWLLCEGQYASSYYQQFKNLSKRKRDVEEVFGETFFEDYENVFLFLRDSDVAFEVPNDRLRDYVAKMDAYMEKRQMDNSKVNSLSRKLKYILKYAKTGFPYGAVHFEDKILQKLIYYYASNDMKVKETADIWHRVLY